MFKGTAEPVHACAVWRTVAGRATGRGMRDAPRGVLACAPVSAGCVRGVPYREILGEPASARARA
jgi:hypothetical protein